jgi:hypothetical protein
MHGLGQRYGASLTASTLNASAIHHAINAPSPMHTHSQGWLSISTEGFAAMNAARPPEHLVKELVQNALDSFADGQPGQITLRYGLLGDHFYVSCSDNGSGIQELADLRVVYLTHKTDSHLKRGRFGRGFKEALCIAEQARVASGRQQLEFLRENGERISRQASLPDAVSGTQVEMQMPWPTEIAEQLDDYFSRFLVPAGVELNINGRQILPRPIAYEISASLSTEVYDPGSQSWKKPSRRTAIQLVPTAEHEQPTIYEMGIPVAALDWSVPFHCNVQQRVPMNPNRDAVASGYPVKLHVACLPTLLEEMDSATVKDDWVGTAGRRCDTTVQQQILMRAYGENIARSVPRVGARHFDEDARDLGVQVVNTAQASGGFREMLKLHVPSAQEVVRRDELHKAEQAGDDGFSVQSAIQSADDRLRLIEQQGGVEQVQHCLNFAVWFCQQLVDSGPVRQQRVSGQLTRNHDGSRRLYAHWSETNVLTLAIDQPCFWQEPLGAESLKILIHEAAHAMNMHHGYEFRVEVERLAGVAASVMFQRGGEVRDLFPGLCITMSSTDGLGFESTIDQRATERSMA